MMHTASNVTSHSLTLVMSLVILIMLIFQDTMLLLSINGEEQLPLKGLTVP